MLANFIFDNRCTLTTVRQNLYEKSSGAKVTASSVKGSQGQKAFACDTF